MAKASEQAKVWLQVEMVWCGCMVGYSESLELPVLWVRVK